VHALAADGAVVEDGALDVAEDVGAAEEVAVVDVGGGGVLALGWMNWTVSRGAMSNRL